MKLKTIPESELLKPKTALCKVYVNHYFILDLNDNFLSDNSGNLLCNPDIDVLHKFVNDNKLKDIHISWINIIYYEQKAGTIVIG